MSDVIFLRGQKTILRPLEPTDAPKLRQWINDPDVRRFLSNVWPHALAGEEAWIRRTHEADDQYILAIETDDGVFIGNMGLSRIDWVNGTAKTGALIGEKAYWGKGYGRDAKMALLGWAFYELGLRRIESGALATNERSLRYQLATGYRLEGRKREHMLRAGRYVDHIETGLLRRDFGPLWEAWKETGSLPPLSAERAADLEALFG